MTKDMRKRTIAYLRAEWSYGVTPSGTLEEILRRSLEALPTTDDATRPFLAGKATIKDRQDTPQGLYLHLVAWADRQAAAAVPHSDKPLLLVPAGEDWDYLTRNGMVMIRHNECLLVPGFNMRASSMKNYLIDLVDHAHARRVSLQEGDSHFELLAIENSQKVQQIYDEGGVRDVDLDIGRYAHSDTATLERTGRLRKITDAITRFIDASTQPNDGLAEEEHLNVRLSVTAGRGGSSRLKYRKLASITRQVRDDGGDGIMIFETVQGTRVRYGELVLRKPVEITKIGNTVDHRHAWREMHRYFRELKISGFLD